MKLINWRIGRFGGRSLQSATVRKIVRVAMICYIWLERIDGYSKVSKGLLLQSFRKVVVLMLEIKGPKSKM